MVNIVKTQGIVLNTRPFKESSLFATIFTNKYGKVTLLAKGCRRPRSKLCGTLERFSLDEIIFYKRENKEIYTLSDAHVINSYAAIRKNSQRINGALVLCEFLEKTLPAEETDTRSFTQLKYFLDKLESIDPEKIMPLTIYHLLKALSQAGAQPHTDHCVKCAQPVHYDNRKIEFSISAGGVVCERDFDDSVIFLQQQTVKQLQDIFSDKDIHFNRKIFSEIMQFIPDYLYYHLNNVILHSLKHLR